MKNAISNLVSSLRRAQEYIGGAIVTIMVVIGTALSLVTLLGITYPALIGMWMYGMVSLILYALYVVRLNARPIHDIDSLMAVLSDLETEIDLMKGQL